MFTNDKDIYDAVVAFKEAAVADGWSISPIYPNHEIVGRAATLTKDGFTMMIYTRTNVGSWKYEADISIWGPDGLTIEPPKLYSWKAIKAGVRRCNHCGADGVDTVRYSFAGRCCKECLPEMQKQHEYPGWYN